MSRAASQLTKGHRPRWSDSGNRGSWAMPDLLLFAGRWWPNSLWQWTARDCLYSIAYIHRIVLLNNIYCCYAVRCCRLPHSPDEQGTNSLYYVFSLCHCYVYVICVYINRVNSAVTYSAARSQRIHRCAAIAGGIAANAPTFARWRHISESISRSKFSFNN